MTTPTFTLPDGVGVSPGAAVRIEPRVQRAQFGDGYIQRSGDGINTIRRRFSFSIGPMAPADAETVNAFLEAHAGWQAFYWTLPREATPRKWVCEGWSLISSDVFHDVIELELTEVFDP